MCEKRHHPQFLSETCWGRSSLQRLPVSLCTWLLHNKTDSQGRPKGPLKTFLSGFKPPDGMEDNFQKWIYWQDRKHRSCCLYVNMTWTVLLFEPVLPSRCRGGGVDAHPRLARSLFDSFLGRSLQLPFWVSALFVCDAWFDTANHVNLPKWQLPLHPAPNPRGSGDL